MTPETTQVVGAQMGGRGDAAQAPSSEDNTPEFQKQPCKAVIHTHLQP